MPEYPDVELYLNALEKHLCGRQLRNVIIRSPFLLRTCEPDIDHVIEKTVQGVSRIGKRIVWQFEAELFLVFHLMIAGRYHMRKPAALPRSKPDLAAFQFESFTLMLTEASKTKRASLHVIKGQDQLAQFDRGGLDVLTCSTDEFAERLREKNRTVKIALIDPTTFDGIGNAYSDEILHAAGMSPFTRTAKMNEDQIEALLNAIRTTLVVWKERLIEQAGEKFPERVTAFRPEMAVHGKYDKPCPQCQRKVQRIRFAEREWNYCAKCQTGGKLLADRSLSRLLKDEWPETIDELDEGEPQA